MAHLLLQALVPPAFASFDADGGRTIAMMNSMWGRGSAEVCRGVAVVARCCGHSAFKGMSIVECIDATEPPLSKTELAVLRCLVLNEPRWLTSGAIIASSLGTAHASDTSLIRVHVHAIRRKLGALGKHVQGRRGRGYRFISGIQAGATHA